MKVRLKLESNVSGVRENELFGRSIVGTCFCVPIRLLADIELTQGHTKGFEPAE